MRSEAGSGRRPGPAGGRGVAGMTASIATPAAPVNHGVSTSSVGFVEVLLDLLDGWPRREPSRLRG